MTRFSGFALAALIAAGFIFAVHWRAVNTVSASEPASTTDFFRDYDPGPVIAKFGKQRQASAGSTSGSGWREATRTRDYDALVDMPENQVAPLTAALQSDIESSLRAHTHLVGSGSGSSGSRFQYESGRSWGYAILEPIEPDAANVCPSTSWHVRMRFIERWRK